METLMLHCQHALPFRVDFSQNGRIPDGMRNHVLPRLKLPGGNPWRDSIHFL